MAVADGGQMLNSTSVLEACGHLESLRVTVGLHFFSKVQLLNQIGTTIGIFFTQKFIMRCCSLCLRNSTDSS